MRLGAGSDDVDPVRGTTSDAGVDLDAESTAEGGARPPLPPTPTLAGAMSAGTLLWRPSGSLLWADACAERIIATCHDGLLELLAADARSLDRGRVSAMVERLFATRPSGWIRARSTACAGVEGIAVVTTLEVVKPADADPVDIARKFQLSEKEIEIARLVAEGLGNRAIGYRVGLATPTVGMYLTRVFRKTGSLDRQDLTRLMLTGLPETTAVPPRSLPAPLVPTPKLPPVAELVAAGARWPTHGTRSRPRSTEKRWRGP